MWNQEQLFLQEQLQSQWQLWDEGEQGRFVVSNPCGFARCFLWINGRDGLPGVRRQRVEKFREKVVHRRHIGVAGEDLFEGLHVFSLRQRGRFAVDE